MIAQFALRLICGMTLTWCLMPRHAVTAGFFRIQMLAVLGLSVLAALTCPQLEAVGDGRAVLGVACCRALCIALAAGAFAGSVIWTLARRTAGTACVYIIAAVAAGTLLGTLPVREGWTPGGLLLLATSELAAAWLVGGATTAMLLGHWHLTAPMMTLEPLQRLNRLFGAAAGVRGMLAAAALATLAAGSFDRVQLIWLGLRWAAGVVGPLVICLLVVRILRHRNTQSATGVLFAGVILTYLGETTAALLFRDLRWPL